MHDYYDSPVAEIDHIVGQINSDEYECDFVDIDDALGSYMETGTVVADLPVRDIQDQYRGRFAEKASYLPSIEGFSIVNIGGVEYFMPNAVLSILGFAGFSS